MNKGFFIAFEGPNHAGKSTLIEAASRQLTHAGHEIFQLREPGGSEYGELLRPILKGRKDITSFAAALGFSSARAQNCRLLIAPQLAAGKVVMADRYRDSTDVFQDEMGDMNDVEKRALQAVHEAMIQPDLTVFMLPSRGLVVARAGKRGGEVDVFEGRPADEICAYYKVARLALRGGRAVVLIEYDEHTQNTVFEQLQASPEWRTLLSPCCAR